MYFGGVMRSGVGIIAAFAFAVSVVAALADNPPAPPPPGMTTEQLATIQKMQAIAAKLHPQFGDVPVPGAHATLHLGKAYYFLPADQARAVLVDAWRNPKEAADGIAGLVFPAGKSFTDDTWAALITFGDEGYIPDDDAKSVDYGAMIKSAQDNEGEINGRRKQEGLDTMHLVGWAQPPYYDQPHHSLIWAREIAFQNQADHTLNYDMRVLGRSGVLSMNILSTMSKLGEVRAAAAQLRNVGTFDSGYHYTDYKSGVDKKAAYGIGGLVAAGIGVALAQKIGLIGVVLLFAKKFIAIILAGAAGGLAWLRRLFGGKSKDQPPMASA
jgi:uncharacterized membrane-anchored protein